VSEYVDTTTGEVFSEPGENRVECVVEQPEPTRQPDSEWLGDWYTRQLARLDAEEKALKAQTKTRLAQIQARRKALEHGWRDRLVAVVAESLTGKRKSVDFAYGRCGWRKARRVEVTDEAAALTWAEAFAPAAVKVTRSLLKSALPAGDVPGVRRVNEDEFYARGA